MKPFAPFLSSQLLCSGHVIGEGAVGGQELFDGAGLVGLCPGSDHAKSMQRVMAYISSILPDRVMWVTGLCKQHSTGLIIAPMTVLYNFLNPLFCTCKLLHGGSFYQHYLEGLWLVVRASVIRWAPEDEQEKNEQHALQAQRVLELTYYGRDLHALTISEAEQDRQAAESAQRLKLGRKLLKCCQGNWQSNHIYHWSENGCCTTDAEAASCCFRAIKDVIGVALPTPALNKWTQVWPCVAQVSLGALLHNVGPRALEYAHTLAVPEIASDIPEDVNPAEDPDDGADIGLPRDARKALAKEKAARAKKSLNWIMDKSTLPTLLLWLCIGRHIMRLHFFLFRDASTMRFTSSSTGEPAPIFDFADTGTSRPSKCLNSLMLLLFPDLDGHRDSFGIVYDRFGTEWPDGLANLAQRGIFLVMGSLWRRLIWFFQRPPWTWVRICNPDLAEEEGNGEKRLQRQSTM